MSAELLHILGYSGSEIVESLRASLQPEYLLERPKIRT